MTADYVLTKNFRVTGEVTICLHGFDLTVAPNLTAFTVSGSGKLNFCDCYDWDNTNIQNKGTILINTAGGTSVDAPIFLNSGGQINFWNMMFKGTTMNSSNETALIRQTTGTMQFDHFMLDGVKNDSGAAESAVLDFKGGAVKMYDFCAKNCDVNDAIFEMSGSANVTLSAGVYTGYTGNTFEIYNNKLKNVLRTTGVDTVGPTVSLETAMVGQGFNRNTFYII